MFEWCAAAQRQWFLKYQLHTGQWSWERFRVSKKSPDMYVVCRAVIAESEKRNIAGVLGEEIQTLHIQNRGLQDEVGV